MFDGDLGDGGAREGLIDDGLVLGVGRDQRLQSQVVDRATRS